MLSDLETYNGDNRLVVLLGLPICLRMIGRREYMINAKKTAQGAGEFCYELLAAVGKLMGRDSIMEDLPIEERTGASRF